MRLNSIGVKLAVTVAAILAVEAAARTYFEAASDAREFREEFMKDGHFHAASVAQAAEYGFLTRDAKELARAADMLRTPEDADLLYVAFYDENGDLLTSRRYGKGAEEVPARMAVVAAPGARLCAAPGCSDREHYLFCVPVVVSRAMVGAAGVGNEMAMVVAARSYAGVQERMAAARREMLVVSAAVFAALMLALLILARRIVKPIRTLAKATERVAGGDLETRVDLGRRRDEFGVLADSFDRMTGQLREQRAQILSHSHELERKVADRTAELNHLNDRLDTANRQFQAVLDNMPASVFLKDREGRYTLVNRAYHDMLPTRVDDPVGLCDRDLFPPRLAEAFEAEDRGVLEDGRAVTKEEPIRLRDGRVVHVAVSLDPVRSSDGRIVGLVGAAVDITDRKRAEDEVRTLKTQIEFVLGATETGLDIIDADYNVRYIDPAWQKVYGDPAGRKCYEYFMGRDSACPDCGIPKALQTKQMTVSEEVLVRENNRPIQVTSRPFQASNGEWLVAEVNVDISERKRAEEAARRENAKLSAMISGMDEGVVFADADGVIVEVNAFFCRFVKKPREAILGSRLEACHSGAVLERLRAKIEQFRANPGSEPFVIQRPLGEAEVILRMQPIYRDGRYDGVLLNVVDVTELVRARQAAEAANARLEELATTDELTGLWNRRRFFEVFKQEFQRVRRHGSDLALAMFDLDHFKTVNDTYGHAFGDRVLVEVARAILGEVRETDVAVRYGGEEFIVLMPSTSSEEAVSAVERIRKRVAQRYISDGKHSVQVTLSAGVSAAEASGTSTPEALLRLADEALYAAKHAGRDCVRTWRQICADQKEEVVSQSKQVDDLQRRMARLSLRSKDAFVQESQGLVQALEARDPYMKSHSVNVTRYAVAVAETLGLDPEETATVRRAAVLHDIGKIGVPDAILRKPGPLSAEERRIMEDHVLVGVRMLEQLNFLDREIALVRHHHERWDGSGYPDGLLGEAIPRGARVLAVADALDAVVSDRVYRGGGTVLEAIRTLQGEAGRQFDPAVVDALVRWVVEVGRGLGTGGEVTCEDLMRSQETTPTPRWLASPDRV